MDTSESLQARQVKRVSEITGFKVEREATSPDHFRIITDWKGGLYLIFHFFDTLDDAEKLAHIIAQKRGEFEAACLEMQKQTRHHVPSLPISEDEIQQLSRRS
jgi:hypothetical protein